MARLSPEKLVYTSAFGDRDPIKTNAGTTPAFHWGTDFGPTVRNKPDVELCAVFAGVATHLFDEYGALGVRVSREAGDLAPTLREVYGARYPKLSITASTPIAISLWHLAKRAIGHGVAVAAGAVVGIMGSTGRSTGVHVHVELSIGGVRVDPKPFIDAQATKAVAPAPATYYAEELDMLIIRREATADVFTIGLGFIRHETEAQRAAELAMVVNPSGKVVELGERAFDSMIDSFGIPRSAPKRLPKDPLRGTAWSSAKDYHDARQW